MSKGGRHVTLHRTLAGGKPERVWGYRIVIEGQAAASDAATVKQARLDEIYDAASQVTGATDIFVTTLKNGTASAYRNPGRAVQRVHPQAGRARPLRKMEAQRAHSKPRASGKNHMGLDTSPAGKAAALAAVMDEAERGHWTKARLRKELKIRRLVRYAKSYPVSTPKKRSARHLVQLPPPEPEIHPPPEPEIHPALPSVNGTHLRVNRTDGPSNTQKHRPELVKWYKDLVARDPEAEVVGGDGRVFTAKFLLARIGKTVGDGLTVKERSARALIGNAKARGWTPTELAQRLQDRGLLGSAVKRFGFKAPLGFPETPAVAADTPQGTTAAPTGAAAPVAHYPPVGHPPIGAPPGEYSFPSHVPPGARPVASASLTVVRLRPAAHPDVIVTRPKPDAERNDIAEWRWEGIVSAWARVDTDPVHLCRTNGITRQQLDHELERRGIRPYDATFDKQIVRDAVPPRRY